MQDELLSVGRDDFTNLLLVYDSCFAAANPRAWCQAHFVHHRALTAAQRVCKNPRSNIFSSLINQLYLHMMQNLNLMIRNDVKVHWGVTTYSDAVPPYCGKD